MLGTQVEKSILFGLDIMKNIWRDHLKDGLLCLIYVGLLGAGIFLSMESLHDYREGKTAYKTSQESVAPVDIPTVTICYNGSGEVPALSYGFDESLLKSSSKKEYPYTESQLRVSNFIGKMASLKHHESYNSCFKVTPRLESFMARELDEDFDFIVKMTLKTESPEQYLVYFTSEENSYGAVHQVWSLTQYHLFTFVVKYVKICSFTYVVSRQAMLRADNAGFSAQGIFGKTQSFANFELA